MSRQALFAAAALVVLSNTREAAIRIASPRTGYVVLEHAGRAWQ